MTLAEIIDNFELLDEWEDRYRYLIELGRTLEPLDPAAHTDENKVKGCASQVWIESRSGRTPQGAPALHLRGDSDAHIVRGLIALVIALYSDRSCDEIVATDAQPLFERLGLAQHLTQQRSNGVRAMVDRIRRDAQLAVA